MNAIIHDRVSKYIYNLGIMHEITKKRLWWDKYGTRLKIYHWQCFCRHLFMVTKSRLLACESPFKLENELEILMQW